MKKLTILPLLFIGCITYGQNPKKIVNIPGAPANAFFSWPCNGLQFYQDYVAATNNTQIWRTDGTATGTFSVTNFAQGDGIVYTSTATAAVVGSIFYFTVIRSGIYRIWRSDGTVNGTYQVDLSPLTSTTSGYIFANSTHVFFTSYSPYEELYSLDNSGLVTKLDTLKVVGAYNSFDEGHAAIFRDKLVVTQTRFDNAGNPLNIQDLFISDGTTSGSYTQFASLSKLPRKMTPCGNEFLLMALPISLSQNSAGATTNQLAKLPGSGSNGIGNLDIFYTFSSTDEIQDYKYHYSSSNQVSGLETFAGNANLGTSIFLSGYSDNHGWELWKTDGTAAGTVLVKDIYPGVGSGYDRWKGFVVNDKFIFYAYTLINGNGSFKLFYSDGTSGGTDFFPQTVSDPSFLLYYVCYNNGKAYFPFNTIAGYSAIWQTDGSVQNTLPITPYNMGPHSSPAPFGLAGNSEILYKTADATGLTKFIASINPNFLLWNGFSDNNWNNPVNWEGNAVPGAGDNVLIPGSVPNYPVINSNASINSLWINAFNATTTNNAILNINGDFDISIYNTLSGSGTINFSGTNNHVFSVAGIMNIPIGITGGNVYINSNVTCRSIDAPPGTSLTINPTYILTVTGQ